MIGADGIRSVVRSRIFGSTTPRDNGRTMWRAVIDENLCHHLVTICTRNLPLALAHVLEFSKFLAFADQEVVLLWTSSSLI